LKFESNPMIMKP
jgi:hypothetical protein